MNLVPFVNLLDYDSTSDLLINIIGNFAMFIPTGIMVPLIYKRIDGMKKAVFTGFMISLIIEVIQLPFAVRASDVDDLILNTAGCLAGYGILCLCRQIKKAIKGKITSA
jgi:glycopeptide antibiotics resistance protein